LGVVSGEREPIFEKREMPFELSRTAGTKATLVGRGVSPFEEKPVAESKLEQITGEALKHVPGVGCKAGETPRREGRAPELS